MLKLDCMSQYDVRDGDFLKERVPKIVFFFIQYGSVSVSSMGPKTVELREFEMSVKKNVELPLYLRHIPRVQCALWNNTYNRMKSIFSIPH